MLLIKLVWATFGPNFCLSPANYLENQAKPPQVITIKTQLSENNQSIEIKIKDNGTGMTEAVKSRIFDNLFTTKDVGKGTGLGLSISQKIVEEKHNGSLICESVLGQGTEFIISIPVSVNESSS
ncbi:MAG: sensor histidine kinase [Nodularia sp. CChRGM 3473]